SDLDYSCLLWLQESILTFVSLFVVRPFIGGPSSGKAVRPLLRPLPLEEFSQLICLSFDGPSSGKMVILISVSCCPLESDFWISSYLMTLGHSDRISERQSIFCFVFWEDLWL
ncbi:hypothetical protein HAX54_029833, partial [Datura stramonium]|nr:hypothetical protein [Datura stramonium]